MKVQVPQKVNLAILAEGHNLPADWGRELFKSFKDSEGLVVCLAQKNGFGYLDFC